MALISDPEYLIHKIRLNYLRDSDDPYAPRIISFDPQYSANPYIDVAGLSDAHKFPELNMPSSPNLSEDENPQGERPSGFPGARIKHSQTIMGGRAGGVGMRTHGKRHSSSKRLSVKFPKHPEESETSARDGDAQQDISAMAPARIRTLDDDSATVLKRSSLTDDFVNSQTSTLHPPTDNLSHAANVIDTKQGPVPDIAVNVQQPTVQEDAPVQKVVQFVPKFRNTAEMERRRQQRMAARRGPGGAIRLPPSPQPIDSSSDSEPAPMEDSSSSSESLSPDSDFEMGGNDADEFDPEFAASRVAGSDSASEGASLATPTSVGSLVLGPQLRDRPRASSTSRIKLSPVSEKPPTESSDGNTTVNGDSSYFPPRRLDHGSGSSHSTIQLPQQQQQQPSRPRTSSHPNPSSSSSLTDPPLSFTKSPVKPLPRAQQRSALTAMLVAHSSSGPNPYSETYAAISGRGSANNMFVRVFFPHATDPRGEALELNVRKDAIIEEVLGFALWSYWEEGWVPRLDEGLASEGDTDEMLEKKREVRFSALGWILRITEEDGEVDDDFPPPDRTAKALKFRSDAFAVLPASPTQVEQNRKIEAQIERRTLGIGALSGKKMASAATLTMPNAEKSTVNLTANNADPSSSTSAPYGSFAGAAGGGAGGESVSASLGMGPSGSRGPQIFLRILIAPTADAAQSLKTIGVSSTMYMQEALELVCHKCFITTPKDYVLLLPDRSIVIPLDRTVASLEGIRELVLVKKSLLPGQLTDYGMMKGAGKTTDPNASIFKRMSDSQAGKEGFSVLDPATAYKKYTVSRKVPMLVTGRERTLAIDGVYVHIMPGGNKARPVFDSAKTESFHIKSIADCQQSGKSQAFKIVINHANGSKRREYEAETPKLAAEIVATIKSIKANLGRSSMMKHSSTARRSRHGIS